VKVLIAEDNAVNRELLREVLESRHYEVIEAADGQEALLKIEESRPDLVLLDINMPVLDGFAVISRVRENPELKQLPVLAVTAYAMKNDREKVLRAGFDGYVSKPVNSAALFREIEQLVKA
jgi:two-component system cell cycle response regulator DivK